MVKNSTLRWNYCRGGNDLTCPTAMASRLEKVAPEMLELRLLHDAATLSVDLLRDAFLW